MSEPHYKPKRSLRLKTALKIAFVAKLVLLACIWSQLDRGIKIGDAPLWAADEAKKTTQSAADDKKSGPGKGASRSEPASASQDAKPKTRQSFLANLLELPPLDPGSLQKDEIGKYLEMAERKKRQIEDRLDLLKKREEQLKKLERSIDEKLQLLDEERRFFAQTIQQEKELKGERLERLVTLYAKMEPKKAAPVFEKLDKDLIVELFKQLPEKQVTAILENLSPDRSVAMSEYYGRVRSAREYDLLKEMNTSLRKEFDDCKGMPAAAAE